MKIKFYAILSAMAAAMMIFASCSDNAPKYTPPADDDDDNDIYVPTDVIYDWEKNRKSIPDNTDMILLYGGSHHRPIYQWSKNRVDPTVTYVDSTGVEHWLFDAFLLIEFMYTESGRTSKSLAYGYTDYSAEKRDWEKLIDYWFADNTGIAAIDASIEDAKGRLGEPSVKHQIVITLPEPILTSQGKGGNNGTPIYWGELNDQQMDFSKNSDCIKALKWYIDEVRARFNEKKYKNVELAGFYWVAEESSHQEQIIPLIAQYIHKYKYSFNWIPYNYAVGVDKWKQHKFDYAWLQPNYYFDKTITDANKQERIRFWFDSHTQKITDYDMDMEIEFMDNAVKMCVTPGGDYWADRLRTYMEKAKENGCWEKRRITYYHDNNAMINLAASTIKEDVELYNEFCDFIISRPVRKLK